MKVPGNTISGARDIRGCLFKKCRDIWTVEESANYIRLGLLSRVDKAQSSAESFSVMIAASKLVWDEIENI